MKPTVRRQIQRIAEETGAPIQDLIEKAVRRFVREYEDARKERVFRRLATAKARSLGIKTLDDVDRIVHSVRD